MSVVFCVAIRKNLLVIPLPDYTATESGCLYVVATPIGNLEDITLRALRTLTECELIAAADTRRTSRLLAHYNIKKRLLSLHRFSEASRIPELISLLQEGIKVALVSDAGTPGISDPGERFIKMCLDCNIPVVAVPGPSAVLHALVVSGLNTTPFLFRGFLPIKKAARMHALKELCESIYTSVFFESPHRLVQTISDLNSLVPQRKICIARELSKLHEEVTRGTVTSVAEKILKSLPRGEYTIVLEGAQEP